MIKQVHIFVIGDVTGVGFRAWTKIQAKYHNITGWVRNIHDREDVHGKSGGVEMSLQGEEKDVADLVELVKKGPPISRVEDIRIMHQAVKAIFDSFEIRK